MNKYLITYDLNNKAIRSYESLFLAIKSVGPWWHYLESTWIVKTNLTSAQIWDYLASHITSTDRMLIVKIDNSDKWGWLPQDAWNWLNS
jgi:hypothetical protein